jgi:Flp pilus assembly protein TadG
MAAMVNALSSFVRRVRPASLFRHERGAVLVEAAFALPLLITLLFGIMVYGNWFIIAHSLQQAADEAARAAVAGLDATERRTLVDKSVAASRIAFPMPNAQAIAVSTGESGGYYTVALRYDLVNAPVFSSAPFPLPGGSLQRSAVVRIDAR